MQTWVATKEDIARVETRLDTIESTMATMTTELATKASKADISAMETRILAAIDSRPSESKGKFIP